MLYILGCLSKGMRDVYTLLGHPDVVDMDLMKCALHGFMTECVGERVSEKCGEDAGKKAQETMADIPQDVREACSSPESVAFFSTYLLTERNRKILSSKKHITSHYNLEFLIYALIYIPLISLCQIMNFNNF